MPPPRRARRGLTYVEIILSLVILGMILSLSFLTYTGWVGRSEEVVCRNQLASLRRTIETWQLSSGRPWFRPGPPADFPPDPWGRAFQVNPRTGELWSLGPPEGHRREQAPSGEALKLAYQPFPTGTPPPPRRVRATAVTSRKVRVQWDWTPGRDAPVGFEVLRAEVTLTVTPPPQLGMPPTATSRTGEFQRVGAVEPEPPHVFDDEGVLPGRRYAYRVRAVPGPGAPGGIPEASELCQVAL